MVLWLTFDLAGLDCQLPLAVGLISGLYSAQATRKPKGFRAKYHFGSFFAIVCLERNQRTIDDGVLLFQWRTAISMFLGPHQLAVYSALQPTTVPLDSKVRCTNQCHSIFVNLLETSM
jgi:hypothetical protein